jgi:hypothetical protein
MGNASGDVMSNSYQLTKCAPSSEKYVLAHDFSNDLAVILRQCDVLLNPLRGNAEARKRLRLIQEAARHMTDRIVDPCHLHESDPPA